MTLTPSVETLGYCQPSLRDEDVQDQLALELPSPAEGGDNCKAET